MKRAHLLLWGAALAAVSLAGCADGDDDDGTVLAADSFVEATRISNGEAPAGFVRIPAGSFSMGCTGGAGAEAPVHTVTLTRALYMGAGEVTQADYKAVVGSLPAGISDDDADGTLPVYALSWYEALAYCNRRSSAEGLTPCYALAVGSDSASTAPDDWGSDTSTWSGITCNFDADGYRLPTEAEWEYAARAGSKETDLRIWSGTAQLRWLGYCAWWYANSADTAVSDGHKAHAVQTKAANAWGLYDMSGNVQEFCWDAYNANQYTTDRKGVADPTGAVSSGAANGTLRVVRGGSYANYLADFCSVTCRWYQNPTEQRAQTGFRVVRLADTAQ